MTAATTRKPEAWSLDELFASFDDPAIEEARSNVEEMVGKFEGIRPNLNNDISAETLLEIIKLSETITQQFYHLMGFGRLKFAANTQDQQAQAFIAQMGQYGANTFNRMIFFSIWWKELDDTIAEPLIAQMGEYDYWLREIRLAKPYTLSEAEEKIVNLKNVNGRSAFDQLYDAIVNRYKFKMVIDGEEQEITREQLGVHYRSTDPAVREAAYKELYRVYGHDEPILGQIYQYIIRDWRSENVDIRGYDSPISVRNRMNDIPDAVVETLIEVVRKNVTIFHRYFKLKAKMLGVEKLRRYDLYAPVDAADQEYAFDKAVDLVLTSFNEFDPAIAAMAERVFDDQHYDGESRDGKMGGAFCATLGPALTPWVLHSYQGKSRDVATMAHELGHAIHSMLAEENSILTQQSCLPLAETASTFGEMLVVDKLMSADPNPAVQRELLLSGMDDHYATVMRQIYFAIFELEAHEAINNGASVTELSDIYLANLNEQFGDAVEVSEDFRYEWVAIPHIYGTPFYVYAYAFGQLLSLALYKQYKEEGDAMIPGYKALLAAGGSKAPVEILEAAGFDVYSAEFWQGGFDVIAAQLEQLEALA